MKKDFNIIFIVIDALRAKKMGCYGNPKAISPNIDRFAEEGIIFKNAYCCNNVTDSSLTSIFSGKYPLSHGIISHARDIHKSSMTYLNSSDTKFLPEILQTTGYKTLAIDWISRWHKRGYDYYSGALANSSNKKLVDFFLRGHLDKYLGLLSRRYMSYRKSMISDSASNITSQAINLIKKMRKSRFFLFLHYWDLHVPYGPPPRFFHEKKSIINFLNPSFLNVETIKKAYHRNHAPYFHMLTKTMKLELIQRYNAAISYIDNEIGKLIAFLERSGLSEDTLIILTSDHGESLVEHGIYFDHHGLYDVSINVPLIMRHPEFPRGVTVEGLVQHIDIVPTILDMLPEKTDTDGIDGKSLIPLINGKQKKIRDEVYIIEEYVQRRAAIRTHRHKYIFAPSKRKIKCRYCRLVHNGCEELYDLQNDPNERNNISCQKSKLKKELKTKLANWLEGFNYFKRFLDKQQNDPLNSEKEILQKLRSLGYV